jgi:glycosyltransferase involved in cell wall biosynthesis
MWAFVSYFLPVIALFLAAPVMVFTAEVIAAALWHKTNFTRESRGPQVRIGVLIPAHNESSAIASTIKNIQAQLSSNDRVVVVADNCTDDTAAIAISTGAEVVERNNVLEIGKGYALDFGLKYFASDPPDVLLVIDADCHFTPGSVELLAALSSQKGKPVQALNLMKAPDHLISRYQLAEFAWRVKNWVRPLGLKRLGLPCQLTGTGMAFPWLVIRSANLATGEIVEDLKLGLELSQAGMSPLFCPGATVISYFPDSEEGANVQRQRWEHGHINMIMTAAPRMVWIALANRNYALLALALDLAVPPVSVLLLIELAAFLVAALVTTAGFGFFTLYITGAAILALAAAIILSWITFGRDILPARRALLVSLELLKRVWVNRDILLRRHGPTAWIRTDRRKSKNPNTPDHP